MGGMVVRLYAAEHPRDVVGLVLADPTNEHQSEGYNRVDRRLYRVWDRANKHSFVEAEKCVSAAKSGSLVKGTDLFESCAAADDPEFSPRINRILVSQSLTYGAQRAMVWEQESTFYAGAAQLAAKPDHYGNKPVLILFRGPDPRRKGQTQGQADAEYKMLVGLHSAVAARSTRGEARLVNGTGHYIQMDAPDVVVNAVFEVLNELSEDAKTN
jgi:pimeloyl-ACP methyl ester carboxylesterase